MPKSRLGTDRNRGYGSDVPLVDESIFADLLANLESETTKKLIQEFLADTSQRCQRLSMALDVDDRIMVCEEAHSLKGAAASFGAARLRIITSELEREAHSGSVKSLRTLAIALKESEQLTAEEFKRLLCRV